MVWLSNSLVFRLFGQTERFQTKQKLVRFSDIQCTVKWGFESWISLVFGCLYDQFLTPKTLNHFSLKKGIVKTYGLKMGPDLGCFWIAYVLFSNSPIFLFVTAAVSVL